MTRSSSTWRSLASASVAAVALAVGALAMPTSSVRSQPEPEAEPEPQARAQPRVPFDLPFTDRAARLDRDRDALVVATLGRPGRASKLAARRINARREAERRGRAQLHAFIDDALAEAHALPRDADAAHRAVRERAQVRAARALVDGGVVLALELPCAILRDVTRTHGVPWRP